MPETPLNVRLLAHTPRPEETIALAARLCYSDSDILSLSEAVSGKAEGFIKRLVSMGHLSPFEHASFTFGAQGVSRSLLAQITRHRIASFSVQSQRYVKKNEAAYVLPPSIAALGPEAVKKFEDEMAVMQGYYDEWLSLGIPAEDARFVLPNAAETRMVFTMNARELLHFFELRCCNRAQWEIRRLAWTMLGICIREAPAIFTSSGPACVSGACSEGKMSCGRMEDVRALSAELAKLASTGAGDEKLLEWANAHIE